jgi:hypothetical protein
MVYHRLAAIFAILLSI